jgi:hypothetical protein
LKNNDDKIWKNFSEDIKEATRGAREIFGIKKQTFLSKKLENYFQEKYQDVIDEKIDLSDVVMDYVYENMFEKKELK